MSDNNTNAEILRAINELDRQFDRSEKQLDMLKDKVESLRFLTFTFALSALTVATVVFVRFAILF